MSVEELVDAKIWEKTERELYNNPTGIYSPSRRLEMAWHIICHFLSVLTCAPTRAQSMGDFENRKVGISPYMQRSTHGQTACIFGIMAPYWEMGAIRKSCSYPRQRTTRRFQL